MMNSMAMWCLAASVALISVTGLQAADEPAAKGKKKAQAAGAGNQVFNVPKEVELTAEQQEKLMQLKKEFGPKLAELQKKLDGVLSADQIQARKDAVAKAKADNLKGKERQQVIDTALNLSAEQKTKWTAAQAEVQELQAKVRAKMGEFLTDEQKAQIPGFAKKKTKKNQPSN